MHSDRPCLGSSFGADTRAIDSARPINFAGPAGRTAATAIWGATGFAAEWAGAAVCGEKNETHEETTGTSNDRLFYTLPNFLTIENTKQIPPLSAKEKFKVVARSSFDYVEYPWYGFLAAVSQAENSEPGYGQGAAGYGKRYGAAFADGTIESFWAGAILPSALHQDPRFYQSGQRGFWRRAGYAISRIFITRTDSGNKTFCQCL